MSRLTFACTSKGDSIVQEAAVPLLTTWQNFYVIIGSAAATLTGLMFVVITLIRRNREPDPSGVAAFGTPNVVHLCAALLVAAILSAPWPALWNADLLLGLCGLWGVTYIAIVIQRARRQTGYHPVLEDWVWHTIFPFASYTALVVAAILLLANPVPALFVIGAATILLLFIGIHNAWDTVTYMAIEQSQPKNKSQG